MVKGVYARHVTGLRSYVASGMTGEASGVEPISVHQWPGSSRMMSERNRHARQRMTMTAENCVVREEADLKSVNKTRRNGAAIRSLISRETAVHDVTI